MERALPGVWPILHSVNLFDVTLSETVVNWSVKVTQCTLKLENVIKTVSPWFFLGGDQRIQKIFCPKKKIHERGNSRN